MNKNCFLKGVMTGKMLKARNAGTVGSATAGTPSSASDYDKASFLAGLAVGMSTQEALRWAANLSDPTAGYACFVRAGLGMMVMEAWLINQKDPSFSFEHVFGASDFIEYCQTADISTIDEYISNNEKSALDAVFNHMSAQSFAAAEYREKCGDAFPYSIPLTVGKGNMRSLTGHTYTASVGTNNDITWKLKLTKSSDEETVKTVITNASEYRVGLVGFGYLPKGSYKVRITSVVTGDDGLIPPEWTINHSIRLGSANNAPTVFYEPSDVVDGVYTNEYSFSVSGYEDNQNLYADVAPYILVERPGVTYTVHTTFDLQCVSLSDNSSKENCASIYDFLHSMDGQSSGRYDYRLVSGNAYAQRVTFDQYKYEFVPEDRLWPLLPFSESTGLLCSGIIQAHSYDDVLNMVYGGSGELVENQGKQELAFLANSFSNSFVYVQDLRILTKDPYPYFDEISKLIKSAEIVYRATDAEVRFFKNDTFSPGIFNMGVYNGAARTFYFVRLMPKEKK